MWLWCWQTWETIGTDKDIVGWDGSPKCLVYLTKKTLRSNRCVRVTAMLALLLVALWWYPALAVLNVIHCEDMPCSTMLPIIGDWPESEHTKRICNKTKWYDLKKLSLFSRPRGKGMRGQTKCQQTYSHRPRHISTGNQSRWVRLRWPQKQKCVCRIY